MVFYHTCQVILRSLTILAENLRSRREDVNPVARPSNNWGDAEFRTSFPFSQTSAAVEASFSSSKPVMTKHWNFRIFSKGSERLPTSRIQSTCLTWCILRLQQHRSTFEQYLKLHMRCRGSLGWGCRAELCSGPAGRRRTWAGQA